MTFPSFHAPPLRLAPHPELDSVLATYPWPAPAREAALRARHPGPAFPPRPAAALVQLLRKGAVDDLSALDWLRLVDHIIDAGDEAAFELLLRLEPMDPLVAVLLVQRATWQAAGETRPSLPWHRLTRRGPPYPAFEAVYAALSLVLRGPSKPVPDFQALGAQPLAQAFRTLHCPLPRDVRRRILCAAAAEDPAPHLRTSWWSTQKDVLTDEELTNVFDALLTNERVARLRDDAALARWLVETITPPVSTGLSSEARAVLSGWRGQVLYRDFQSFADALHALDPYDKDMHRLKSRTLFWSMYQRQMLSKRVLAPRSEYGSGRSRVPPPPGVELARISSDPRQQTEVCIFEFPTLIVVELFRGEPGETRVFPRTERSEAFLTCAPPPTLEQIRAMGGRALDHVVGWQPYACRVLAAGGLRPDPGTTHSLAWNKQSQRLIRFPLGPSGLGTAKSTSARERDLRRFADSLADAERRARATLGK